MHCPTGAQAPRWTQFSQTKPTRSEKYCRITSTQPSMKRPRDYPRLKAYLTSAWSNQSSSNLCLTGGPRLDGSTWEKTNLRRASSSTTPTRLTSMDWVQPQKWIRSSKSPISLQRLTVRNCRGVLTPGQVSAIRVRLAWMTICPWNSSKTTTWLTISRR